MTDMGSPSKKLSFLDEDKVSAKALKIPTGTFGRLAGTVPGSFESPRGFNNEVVYGTPNMNRKQFKSNPFGSS